MSHRRVLQLDPLSCQGHGLCAEEFPERISLDEWGYPILAAGPVPRAWIRRAKIAAAACPVLALKLAPAPPPRPDPAPQPTAAPAGRGRSGAAS